MSRRDEYLKRLWKLRKGGWENPVQPYGIPFNEESKTDSEILHHVWKIEKYRHDVIQDRLKFTFQLIGLLLFMCILIFR